MFSHDTGYNTGTSCPASEVLGGRRKDERMEKQNERWIRKRLRKIYVRNDEYVLCVHINTREINSIFYLPNKGEKSPQPLVSDEELRSMTEEAINTQAFVFNQLGRQKNYGASRPYFPKKTRYDHDTIPLVVLNNLTIL